MTNDSNKEVLIFKYLSGEASVNDCQLLKDYVESDPDFEKQFIEIRDIWNVSNSEEFDASLAFTKFKNRIGDESNQKTLKIKTWVRWVGVAASIVVMFFVGRYLVSNTESDIKYYSYQTGKGERKIVYLQDSTQVWLGSESKLTFSSDYSVSNRNIRFDGEGFFDVTHNSNLPFIVKSGNHNVRVLGTRFNLLARSNSSIIETVLEEGKVQVDVSEVDVQCLLLPGQKSVYNKESLELRVQEEENMTVYTALTKGQLVFKNEPLRSLTKRLETWFGVTINIAEGVENLRFTGVLENESIDDIMNIISMSEGIKYKRINNTITISKK